MEKNPCIYELVIIKFSKGGVNMHVITLIPGDGIGPEVMEAAVSVIEATGVDISWENRYMGSTALEKYKSTMPENFIKSMEDNRVAFKGPVSTLIGGFRSVNIEMRQRFNLYANIRPIKSIKGVTSRYENVDLIIFRENTEDLYVGYEHMIGKDIAESIRIITREASERIASMAFSYAVKEKRKKVTCLHKANVMQLTDGLFLSSVRAIAAKFPDIEYTEMTADYACLQLVQDPSRFDVIVTPNLYGDLITDLCAGLVGGLGVVPGVNLGADTAVFEATHGTAMHLVGKGIANPAACIMSGVMMLKYLGEKKAAERIEVALHKVLADGKYTTPDLGGTSNTKGMVDAIISEL